MSTPKERITDDVAEHLARLLQNADQLLGEWQRYSERLRDTLDERASEAGERAARAMRTSLEELRGQRDSAQPSVAARGPWLWMLVVNLAIGIALAALIVRQSGSASPPLYSDAAPPPPVDAAPPDAGLLPDAPPPPPPLCAGLLRGVTSTSALHMVRACAVVACGFEPPAKDPKNRALLTSLAECKPDREAATVLALTELLGDDKALARCRISREADGSFAVNERFLASCRDGKPAK